MKVLCDTNAITALRLGNVTAIRILEEADAVLLSVVVLGDLLYGYKTGSKEDENRRFLDAFIAKPRVQVLLVDAETSAVYADLRQELKRIGKPIPTNDLWIAAQAIEQGAVLLTNDAHFDGLIGLRKASY